MLFIVCSSRRVGWDLPPGISARIREAAVDELLQLAVIALVVVGFVAIFIAVTCDSHGTSIVELLDGKTIVVESVVSACIALAPASLSLFGLTGPNLWRISSGLSLVFLLVGGVSSCPVRMLPFAPSLVRSIGCLSCSAVLLRRSRRWRVAQCGRLVRDTHPRSALLERRYFPGDWRPRVSRHRLSPPWSLKNVPGWQELTRKMLFKINTDRRVEISKIPWCRRSLRSMWVDRLHLSRMQSLMATGIRASRTRGTLELPVWVRLRSFTRAWL